MIVRLVFSLLIALAIGLVVVRGLGPRPPSRWIRLIWQLALAVGIGLGLSSCTFFLWALLFNPLTPGLLIAEIVLCSLLAVGFAVWNRRRRHGGHPIPPTRLGPAWLPRMLAGACALAVIVAVVRLVCISWLEPNGGWDAWAIWNTHARFLFRGGEHWRDSFSSLLVTHPNYPPLLPMAVARLWVSAGDEILAVPALVAGLFTLATVGTVIAALGILRSQSQASLAGLVLLGTDYFLEQGASQYADVPLGFFIVTTIALCLIADQVPESSSGSLRLAGVTAGCAALTKNEGLLFVVAVVIGRALILVPQEGFLVFLRRLTPFVLGLLPVLAFLGYFKWGVAPPIDAISLGGLGDLVNKIFAPSRYVMIINHTMMKVVLFCQGAILLPFALLMGVVRRETRRSVLAPSAAVVGLMMVGYFVAYLLSPYELEWHLRTSVDRLLIQLWPSAVLLAFVALRAPEDMVIDVLGRGRR